MINTLEPLALEYFSCAGKQDEIIQKFTLKKKKAQAAKNYSQITELSSQIARLYEIKNELLDTAGKLQNYYN